MIALVDRRRFTREQERALAESAHAGDMEAKNELAKAVLPFAMQMVFRLNRRIDVREGESLAGMAVVTAIADFDPDRGRLSTLVAWHVRKELYHSKFHRGIVYVPHSGWNTPALQECAERATKRPVSLDCVNDDGDSIGRSLKSSESPDQLEYADWLRVARSRFTRAVNKLTPKQRQTIIARSKGRTFRDISEEMGVTKSAVQILERKALQHLERMLAKYREQAEA